ncbi:coiled-coil domain-containing protein 89 [Pungitius pungitius]|uniref:coiled-coil domain-containing protein 89 n=1 Tax=Pungitius pungitius TaxID=134920 RepID=UPI002E0DC57B
MKRGVDKGRQGRSPRGPGPADKPLRPWNLHNATQKPHSATRRPAPARRVFARTANPSGGFKPRCHWRPSNGHLEEPVKRKENDVFCKTKKKTRYGDSTDECGTRGRGGGQHGGAYGRPLAVTGDTLLPSTEGAKETGMLRSRIDEQSSLIVMLKQRADEVLLRSQALQALNADLEGRVAEHHKELDGERKRGELLEKRFMDLAANNQAIIAFMNDHKEQNCKLKMENKQLQLENETLFSQKLHDKELLVQKLKQEIKKLTEKQTNKENEYRFYVPDLCLRFEREAEAVNADVKVKSIQSALDTSASKYRKLEEDFEAFKDHSTSLLLQERELNKKLRHMMV